MRSWQTTKSGSPSDVLELVDGVPSPAPRPDTVHVEVLAAGIGLPDALMCQGSYVLAPPFPFTQGQEVVGRVLGWGDGIEGRQVGDRVMAVTSFFTGNGSFAEECLALDDFCLPVPDAMTDAEAAAFLIPMHTAWVGLVSRGQLRAGETLLVLGGAGGTGSAAVQLGKALGADVIATVAGPEKVAYCRELGADHVIDRREQDIAETVRELTNGRGVECVYDPVGGAAYKAASRCIAHEGRILLVGFASGTWGQPDPAHMVTENYSVLGIIPSHYDRAYKEAAQEKLVALWQDGRLRVHVDEVVPFDALPRALERLAANEVQGKLVLGVHPDATAPR